MAVGDIYIRRNAGDTTSVPNAGTNLDSTWDTVALNEGSAVNYSGGNFQLDIGKYLIMYSEKFNTTDTTNNERIEIQGEIHESGVGVVGGYSQDFIRKSSGQQDCVLSGGMILDVTANDTDYFIRFYRTDDSTAGTVDRVPGVGGVQIIQLDATDNYGLYSTSASEATTGTTIRTLNININDQQDTGFSRTGDIVTVSNAGRYLMTYSLDLSQTSTGREDAVGFIERNSTTPVVGSYSFCYIRGADGCQDGAITWMGLVDVNANDTFRVRWSCPTSATITAAAGATFQMWQLPSGSETAIMEATTGDYNASGDFTFDTLPHIDTGSFTATAGTSNIDVDQADYVLSFATFSQASPDTPQRAYPELTFQVDDVNVNYMSAGMYHRNSGGSGTTAVNIAGVVQIPLANSSIEVSINPTGVTGTLNNDSGQFSTLSLSSVFGAYTFPPNITDFNTTESFTWESTNLVITGGNFQALQGAGKVEFWDDQAGTTKTVQTIDSWSDTSIQIDTVRGSLPDDTTVYLVVTSDGGLESTPFAVNVGVFPYETVIGNLNPDHYWTFNNTYNDIGDQGPNNCSVTAGSPGFTTNPLSRGRSHAFTISEQGQRIEPPNSDFMNGEIETTRSMGGWVRITSVQDSFVCFYEEGGGVNNLAFFMGIGGVLIAQMADTGDDNVHAYSDFKLQPNRDYHILFRFDYTTTGRFDLLVDGKLQSVTFGNPLVSTDLDGHSGDIGWGDASGTLEVFGTDIIFPAAVTSYYQDWASWTVFLSESTVRSDLFVQGARSEITITSDTQANMQTALDVYTSTTRPDAASTFRIENCTDGDFTLDFDNITFNDGTSIQVLYVGSNTLTANNLNGSNLTADKIETPYGGTVNLITPSTLTVSGLQNNTEVRVYETGTTTEVAGIESTSGDWITSLQTSSIDISILNLNYQNIRLKAVDTSSDTFVPVVQRVDRQFLNP